VLSFRSSACSLHRSFQRSRPDDGAGNAQEWNQSRLRLPVIIVIIIIIIIVIIHFPGNGQWPHVSNRHHSGKSSFNGRNTVKRN